MMESVAEEATGASGDVDRRKSAALARESLKVRKETRLVSDFQAAREILRSAKVRQAGAGAELLDISDPAEVGIFYLDGEAHKRKRGAVAKYFTLKAIETRYRDIMERTTETLLEGFRAAGSGKLDALGFQLAVAVAAEIIGLDHRDLEGLARRIEATLSGPNDRVPVRPADDPAIIAFFEIDVRPAIEARRGQRGEDVISRLLDEGWSDGAILTEVLAYAIAGMLTTREFITMAAWYLFERPDLRARFCAGTRDVQFAILEEILRLEPIVAVVTRRAVEDIDLPACGHIPAGTLMAIDVRAANMDEGATGPCPHRVDPDRSSTTAAGSGFMSFGDGNHRCPGAQLSFHEVRIFLDRLFRLPGLKLDSGPRVEWYRCIQSYELHDALISCERG